MYERRVNREYSKTMQSRARMSRSGQDRTVLNCTVQIKVRTYLLWSAVSIVRWSDIPATCQVVSLTHTTAHTYTGEMYKKMESHMKKRCRKEIKKI